MKRTLPVLGAGVVLGIIATLAFNKAYEPLAPPPAEVVRDIVDVPEMSETAAEQHRAEQYAGLTSIEEILALPTEFARSEAMHLLAGRSGSAAVRNLALEANRIADDIEREAVLIVLFSRLTELDPQSALQLARADEFSGLSSLEDAVWHVWARNDLDDALFAAKTQTRFAEQRRAARSLYKAFGYLGNDVTDRIEAELGIEPDVPTRARYLYRLADRSPAEAIEYIDTLQAGRERDQAISWLAYYLSLDDPRDALQYAGLFDNASEGAHFSGILEGNIASAEPVTTIEKMLAGDLSDRAWGQVQQAAFDLASTDFDALLQYFEQAGSDQHRQVLGAAIVAELAKSDPAEALAWARANDRGRMPAFEMAALKQIAQTDPQLALHEALASPSHETRRMLVGNIVAMAAMTDPANAISLLDQIDDRQQKLQASETLVDLWMQKDADAAIEWILGQDEGSSGQLLMRAMHDLASSDVDAAIRLLPKLDEEFQVQARQRIAESLGETRSIDEVQAFVLQFQGQPDYDRLQATVVASVARNDVLTAKRLADQVQDSNLRDSAYMQIINEHAESNPVEALGWLASIADETRRSQAMARVAAQWHERDPVAAMQWVSNLPRESARDDAIVQLAGRWGDATAQQAALIASIGDQEKRGQAKLRQIYAVMRTDPEEARTMLDDDDIPEEQRNQVEQNIDRSGFRY